MSLFTMAADKLQLEKIIRMEVANFKMDQRPQIVRECPTRFGQPVCLRCLSELEVTVVGGRDLAGGGGGDGGGVGGDGGAVVVGGGGEGRGRAISFSRERLSSNAAGDEGGHLNTFVIIELIDRVHQTLVHVRGLPAGLLYCCCCGLSILFSYFETELLRRPRTHCSFSFFFVLCSWLFK